MTTEVISTEYVAISGLVAALGGYFLGSVPFGLVLTKMAGLGDIRSIGSGNIGATNVLRTGNKPLAAATLILDAVKGAIAVGLAAFLIGWAGPVPAPVLAGIAAVIGHNFPVWLRFRGGKGVATGLGVLLSLAWPVGAAACATWLAAAFIFRMSSLAALIAFAAAPILAYLLQTEAGTVGSVKVEVYVAASILLAALCWIRHRANIARILAGTEPRIGAKKSQ